MDQSSTLNRLTTANISAFDPQASSVEIDNEHAHLDRDMDDLARAAEFGAAPEKLIRLLDMLILDTQTHFENEENFMRNFKYPRLKAHSEHHRLILMALEERLAEVKNGEPLQVDAVDETRVMLNLHVDKDDREFGIYLSNWAIA